MKTFISAAAAAVLLWSAPAFSQGKDTPAEPGPGLTFADTHSLFIYGGTLINSSSSAGVSGGGVSTEMHVKGGIGYEYWFKEEWSLSLTAGIFGTETQVSGTNISTIVVSSFFAGISWYPRALTLGKAGRAWAGAKLGVCTGTGSGTDIGFFDFGAGVINETVMGGEIGAGIDLRPLKWLRIGPVISYTVTGEFKDLPTANDNAGGAAFSFVLGVFL